MVAHSKGSSSNSCDGNPLAPLAKKVPRVRRSGDLSADTRASIERDAFVRIVDKLSKYPAFILPMRGIIMSQDFSGATVSGGKSANNDEWAMNCRSIGKIPKTWIAEWLLHRATT